MSVFPRPTGHRILIQPDIPPDISEGGLQLPQDRDYIPMSGVVVALGPGGSELRYRTRQRAIQDCIEMLESTKRMFGPMAALQVACENVAGLLGTSEPEREVHVGDRVVFGGAAGLRLVEDGKEYIILNEDDCAVVVEESEAAA